MKNKTIEFKKGTIIELSFATIEEGMENQVFGDYFPQVMPIVGELGGVPLGSFHIVNSASSMPNPEMCAFFQWPSIDAFEKLHSDARFLSIKRIRDDALSFFSNGHFFVVEKDICVDFREGKSYALVTERINEGNSEDSLVAMTNALALSSDNHKPTRLNIIDWKEDSEHLKTQTGSGNDQFEIVCNLS